MELRTEIASLIWGMDQNSVERPFEKLPGPVLDDLFDTADAILSLPAIAEALAAYDPEPPQMSQQERNERARAALDKVTLGHSISTGTRRD